MVEKFTLRRAEKFADLIYSAIKSGEKEQIEFLAYSIEVFAKMLCDSYNVEADLDEREFEAQDSMNLWLTFVEKYRSA